MAQHDTHRITFTGALGETLAARLDMPSDATPRAFALFAHCFTCSKETKAAKRVSAELAAQGFAVLRFDFTGLGGSEGDFANTNFSSNVADLVAASDWLRDNHHAPSLLIGHSLGGAAVLAAGGDIPEVKAIATIGAPADVEHVLHNFGADLDRIDQDGVAEVSLAGRPFTIKKQFLENARAQDLKERIGKLRRALLVLHAPTDAQVGIENAGAIFSAAKHPKSFMSLDGADHLLTDRNDARFAAHVIAAWAARYLPESEDDKAVDDMDSGDVVRVTETGKGKFQQSVQAGRHSMFADEPASYGGLDSGPAPYDFLSIGLAACTAMTLRLYADHKGINLGKVSVDVSHGKVHAEDCAECLDGRTGKIDRFERTILIEGGVAEDITGKILEIADKCPVHKTLESASVVVTQLDR
ncbi:MAG: bifunctional alpha/beta hydrolase/OsmC family protein [Pseudomonadota bacterium]